MIRSTLALAFIAFAAPATTTAQLPVGYTEVSPTTLPDSLREVLTGGRFVISISRVAASNEERRMIERAESIFPPADAIDAATRKGMGQSSLQVYHHSNIPGPRWWLREWNGVLVPYALTGTAARYYVDRVRTLATGPNPLEHYEPGFLHRSSMEYVARITRTASGFEVHLRLAFSYVCGKLCGVGFAHARVVEFDQAGTFIRVREVPSLIEVS